MPWVNTILGKTVSKAEQEQIKSEIAEMLKDILGKEERGLSATFCTADGFYRSGEASSDAAVVEVQYIGQYPLAKKQEITRRMCDLLAKSLSLSPLKVIILFSEFPSENWGRKTGNFQ
jgi:phenylpyruvate tautomerase PptA (4-oxalocrotonate tautomerase family)